MRTQPLPLIKLIYTDQILVKRERNLLAIYGGLCYVNLLFFNGLRSIKSLGKHRQHITSELCANLGSLGMVAYKSSGILVEAGGGG